MRNQKLIFNFLVHFWHYYYYFFFGASNRNIYRFLLVERVSLIKNAFLPIRLKGVHFMYSKDAIKSNRSVPQLLNQN